MISTSNTATLSKLSKAMDGQIARANLISGLKSRVADAHELKLAQVEAREIITKVGEDCQRQFQAQLSYIVTRCLQEVFEDGNLQFRLIYEQKRNQTEVRAVISDGTGNDYDPLRSKGGGLVDVASFGLRLACLMLRRPQPAKVLILDEPFKWVSAGYQHNVSRMLQNLSGEFGMQILMVSHLPELLEAGTVVEIRKS